MFKNSIFSNVTLALWSKSTALFTQELIIIGHSFKVISCRSHVEVWILLSDITDGGVFFCIVLKLKANNYIEITRLHG